MIVANLLKEKGSDVITINMNATIQDVVDIMANKCIGAVVVVDDNQKLCGIISERDVVREMSKQGSAILDHAVNSCMTSKVIRATQSDTINHVMEEMTKGRFRHLPVVDGDRLIGLISIGDVVKRKIEMAEKDADELRNYIAS